MITPVQPQPQSCEAQLDIDRCTTCDGRGWKTVESFGCREEFRAQPQLIMIWLPCPECNADRNKPQPWDA